MAKKTFTYTLEAPQLQELWELAGQCIPGDASNHEHFMETIAVTNAEEAFWNWVDEVVEALMKGENLEE